MLATTGPDFVLALGRHRQMAAIAHDLLDQGYPFLMEKPMGIKRARGGGGSCQGGAPHAFVAVPLAQRYAPFAMRAASCSPRDASAHCRTFTSGSTGRDRHATQRGIARGCSILPRRAVAVSGTWARTGWTCSFYLTGRRLR